MEASGQTIACRELNLLSNHRQLSDLGPLMLSFFFQEIKFSFPVAQYDNILFLENREWNIF